MKANANELVLSSHHLGACDFHRYYMTHKTRLATNDREATEAHIKRVSRGNPDVEACKFQMLCEAAGRIEL